MNKTKAVEGTDQNTSSDDDWFKSMLKHNGPRQVD